MGQSNKLLAVAVGLLGATGVLAPPLVRAGSASALQSGFVGATSEDRVGFKRFEYERPAMGSSVRLVFFAPDSTVANRAAESAFNRVVQLESRLSDYDPESEISRLAGSAGSGQWIIPSDDLWRLVVQSQEWSARTEGAFDITVGPLTRLWRWADRRGMPMPEGRRTEAARLVGWRLMELDRGRRAFRLARPGMRLDVGGVGKGFVVDEVFERMVQAGLPSVLVDAGGDVRIGEAPPDGSEWRVALPTLSRRHEPDYAPDAVRQVAIATSGDSYRHTSIDGERFSHLMDPRTGRSLTRRRIVTVVASTATVADAVASAASVLSVQELKTLDGLSSDVRRVTVLEYDPSTERWTRENVQLRRGVIQ